MHKPKSNLTDRDKDILKAALRDINTEIEDSFNSSMTELVEEAYLTGDTNKLLRARRSLRFNLISRTGLQAKRPLRYRIIEALISTGLLAVVILFFVDLMPTWALISYMIVASVGLILCLRQASRQSAERSINEFAGLDKATKRDRLYHVVLQRELTDSGPPAHPAFQFEIDVLQGILDTDANMDTKPR